MTRSKSLWSKSLRSYKPCRNLRNDGHPPEHQHIVWRIGSVLTGSWVHTFQPDMSHQRRRSWSNRDYQELWYSWLPITKSTQTNRTTTTNWNELSFMAPSIGFPDFLIAVMTLTREQTSRTNPLLKHGSTSHSIWVECIISILQMKCTLFFHIPMERCWFG